MKNKNTPADKRPDAELAQWPGDARKQPGSSTSKTGTRKPEKTVIPTVR